MTQHLNDRKDPDGAFAIYSLNNRTAAEFESKTERLDDYEIVWIKTGNCDLRLNLKTYVLGSNTICVLGPGQVRNIELCESADVVHFRLSADFFYRLCVEVQFPIISANLNHEQDPLIISLQPGAELELNEIIRNLERELPGRHNDSATMRNVWLKLFLLYLKRQVSNNNFRNVHNRDMELVNHFLRLLSQDYTTKKMVSDYATLLSVTPNYLNLIVKRVSGFSASHHIQQFLIMEAKRQAILSVKSMKEIAYGLGFDNTAHFSKFFKNKSGTNFTDFKKERLALQFQS